MKNIWKRLKASTPKFFKKVRAFGLSLIISSLAGLAYKDQIHPLLAVYLGHALTAGVALTFIAQLTMSNPEDLKKTDQP